MQRKLLDQKSTYSPQSSIEEFIVPLLKDNILKEISAIDKTLPQGLKRCLDVGCGNQPFRAFIESLGFKYTSIDVIQNKYNSVDFIAQIDANLPESLLNTSPYHFIICTEVLEHVADWDKAFQNLNMLLAPDGLLLITCPHYYVLHEQPYDFWRPTIHAIRHFSHKHFLKEISIYPVGSGWDIIGTVLGGTDISMLDYSLKSKIIFRITKFAKSVVFAILKSRVLQKRIAIENHRYPTYLSNIALLTK